MTVEIKAQLQLSLIPSYLLCTPIPNNFFLPSFTLLDCLCGVISDHCKVSTNDIFGRYDHSSLQTPDENSIFSASLTFIKIYCEIMTAIYVDFLSQISTYWGLYVCLCVCMRTQARRRIRRFQVTSSVSCTWLERPSCDSWTSLVVNDGSLLEWKESCCKRNVPSYASFQRTLQTENHETECFQKTDIVCGRQVCTERSHKGRSMGENMSLIEALCLQ